MPTNLCLQSACLPKPENYVAPQTWPCELHFVVLTFRLPQSQEFCVEAIMMTLFCRYHSGQEAVPGRSSSNHRRLGCGT